MLDSDNPCDGFACPAIQLAKRDKPNVKINNLGNSCSEYSYNEICKSFVGIDETKFSIFGCPCHIFGHEEAIRITLLKIKEYERSVK